jgi:HAMP domain-containing protein
MNIVEFPKLHLKFHLDPVAFTIVNLPIFWYGVIIATAFLVAVVLALRSCRKFGFIPDNIIDMIENLSSGNISIEIPYIQRKDEIGKLACGVELLQQSIEEEQALKEELQETVVKLEELSIKDSLTG